MSDEAMGYGFLIGILALAFVMDAVMAILYGRLRHRVIAAGLPLDQFSSVVRKPLSCFRLSGSLAIGYAIGSLIGLYASLISDCLNSTYVSAMRAIVSAHLGMWR